MYSDWTASAHKAIAHVTAGMDGSTPLADRKRALRDFAYNFHGGTSWGRKVWGRECRKHLELHGQPKRSNPQEPTLPWSDDVSFPFRGRP